MAFTAVLQIQTQGTLQQLLGTRQITHQLGGGCQSVEQIGDTFVIVAQNGGSVT
jgi:hypothetical protein